MNAVKTGCIVFAFEMLELPVMPTKTVDDTFTLILEI